MTLVYRSPKLIQAPPKDTPGPDKYQIPPEKITAKQATCSFVSKVTRTGPKDISGSQIGPGSYFNNLNEGEEKKQAATLAVFKSRIERFKNEQTKQEISREKKFANEFNELMRRQRQDKETIGRLMGWKDRKQIAQIDGEQHLPSIPTSESSFGYRYDTRTGKLVHNPNPKIIFAQTLKQSQNKDDYYFQRSHANPSTKNKVILNGNSKRSSPELIHQLASPKITKYCAQKYHCIEEDAKNGSIINAFISKHDRFGEESPSKKDILKLNKFKRQFKQYLNQSVNLKELQHSKHSSLNGKSYSPEKKQEKSENRQFFLTKQERFKPAEPKKNDSSIKISTKTEPTSPQQTFKMKQQYDVGGPRFKERLKEHLGPGSYDCNENISSQRIANLKFSQQRFKQSKTNKVSPGPGAYEISHPIESEEKPIVHFNRYRNHDYFHIQTKLSGKFQSMENLYQQVGKHMNYLCKIQKDSKKRQNTKENHRKKYHFDGQAPLSKVKSIIKEKIELKTQDTIIESELRLQQFKNIKYEHLYSYNKPEQKTSGVGPGHYDIRSNLQKKSFNKSVVV